MANRNDRDRDDRDHDYDRDRDRGGRSNRYDDRDRDRERTRDDDRVTGGKDRRDAPRARSGSSKGRDNERNNRMVTCVVRMSYEHVWKAWAGKNPKEGDKPKYQFQALIPNREKATLEKLEDLIEQAKEEGREKWPKRNWESRRLAVPEISVGRDKYPDNPDMRDVTCVSFKSVKRPGIIDQDSQEILDESEIYSGCYVKAEISVYPYSGETYYGIAIGLNHIKKVKDGEPLGGGQTDPNDVAWGDDDRDDDRRSSSRGRDRDDDRRGNSRGHDDDRRGSSRPSRSNERDNRDDDRGDRGGGRRYDYDAYDDDKYERDDDLPF